MPNYSQDKLVQQTTADYLQRELGWRSVYAYNHEDFRPDSLLGRGSNQEVILKRTLREKLDELNPSLPDEAYDDAVRQIISVEASDTLASINREKYDLHRDGVQVAFTGADRQRRC